MVRADEGELSDIKTLTGKSYSQCQVVRVYPDGVTFRHSNGMAKVQFTDLTPEGRKHFGYDATKADAYERKIRDERAKAREVSAAKAAEAQKAWAEAYSQALQLEALAAMQQGPYRSGGYYGFVNFGLDTANTGWNGNTLGFHDNLQKRCGTLGLYQTSFIASRGGAFTGRYRNFCAAQGSRGLRSVVCAPRSGIHASR